MGRTRSGLLVAVVGVAVVAGSSTPVSAESLASSDPATTTIDSDYNVDAVGCPSASQCTAVDYDGRDVTFNPAAPGTPTQTTINSVGDDRLTGVACPSTS